MRIVFSNIFHSLIWLTYVKVFLSIFGCVDTIRLWCIFLKYLPNKNKEEKPSEKKDAICSTYACLVFLIFLFSWKFYPFIICGNSNKHTSVLPHDEAHMVMDSPANFNVCNLN